jgi:hypothetical protein
LAIESGSAFPIPIRTQESLINADKCGSKSRSVSNSKWVAGQKGSSFSIVFYHGIYPLLYQRHMPSSKSECCVKVVAPPRRNLDPLESAVDITERFIFDKLADPR